MILNEQRLNLEYKTWLLKLGLFETRYIIFGQVCTPEYFEQDDGIFIGYGKIYKHKT